MEQHLRVPLRSLLRPDTDLELRRRRFLATKRRLPLLLQLEAESLSSSARERRLIASMEKEVVERSEKQGRLVEMEPPCDGGCSDGSRVLER